MKKLEFMAGGRLWCVLSVFVLLAVNTCFAGVFDEGIKPADAQVAEYVPQLKGKHVALIINQTSMVGSESLLDILLREHVDVKKIFVPEHGFRGKADAGAHVDNTVDSATGIPVISLYGSHKKPKPADLEGIDVMVYDLQDVGVRFYTYISTMEYCMEACAEGHVQFMVLDRPNPNGFYIDGPVMEKEHASFVGMEAIPVVYGMTPGEYARMIAGERWFNVAADLDLKVVKCEGYDHSKKYKLPVMPSPNLKSMAAVYAYPSICLFEGTVVSVGRGTERPFVQYGCPEFEGRFAYSFTPQSMAGAKNPPYENKACYGELIGIDEADVLGKIRERLQIKWVIGGYNMYPDKDKFFTPFFMKLTGTASLMERIKNGDSEDDIRRGWQKGIKNFKKIRKKYLLYKDFE